MQTVLSKLESASSPCLAGGCLQKIRRVRLNFRQTKENPHKQPKVDIVNVILITRQSSVGHRIQQHESEPETSQCNWEEARLPKAKHHAPAVAQERSRPKNPKEWSDDSHFDDQIPIPFFDAEVRGRPPY